MRVGTFNGKLIHSLALRACIVGNVGITLELAPLGWRRFYSCWRFALNRYMAWKIRARRASE